MVKGISRRVIVVDSPDPKLFEQAIFILRSDVLTGEGVTPQQVLGEACRIARGYAAGRPARPPLWRRIPRWCYFTGAALAAAAVWLAINFLLWEGGLFFGKAPPPPSVPARRCRQFARRQEGMSRYRCCAP